MPLVGDDATDWNVNLDSILVHGSSVVSTAGVALIDSQTRWISGPLDAINSILNSINSISGVQASNNGDVNIATVQCANLTSLPDLTLVLTGGNLTYAVRIPGMSLALPGMIDGTT